MATEPLIDRLVADLRPVRPRTLRHDAMVIALVCVLELLLFFGMGSMRHHMPAMMPMPMPMPRMPVHRMPFWWKLSSLLLVSLLSGAAALLSFRPPHAPRRMMPVLGCVLLAILATGWAIDAGQGGLQSLLERLDWRNGLTCTYKMVMLSMPAVAVMGVLMRRGAATDLPATALAAGLAAAAWGAFMFVFACPSNDPLYIVVWYALGCGVVTLFARLVLPRVARW